MTNIHPLETTRHLDAAYKQYLRSLLVMNDPQLNTLYVEELQREVLIKGPYLEGTLPFASTSKKVSQVIHQPSPAHKHSHPSMEPYPRLLRN